MIECCFRRGRSKPQIKPHVGGFTLIELLMVVVLVGILSIVATSRFSDKTFDERGFHDAVKSALQHARQMAVASRRFVCVTVTADLVSLKRNQTAPEGISTPINCNTNLALPSLGRGCSETNQVCAPNGVSLTATGGVAVNDGDGNPIINEVMLIFDPLGRLVSAPSVVASIATIEISNQSKITIVPETGFVE